MPDEKNKQPDPGRDRSETDQNEEEEIDIRIEKPREELLNRTRSAFEGALEKRFGGINTAPSVFEKGVLFQTDSSGHEEE
jgi:hypothetical protein